MDAFTKFNLLSLSMRLIGIVFIFGIYPLTLFWPSGWLWHPGQSEYLQMILVVYATLGVFLFVAARNPIQHQSLISFTLWSSLLHGLVMAIQASVNSRYCGHLIGDVHALLGVAFVLAVLSPRSLAFWKIENAIPSPHGGAPSDATQ